MAVPGMLVTVICAIPASPNCVEVNRIRVMIDASHVTTGVTPVALGVQYCELIGIVKIFEESIGWPVVCPGGVKKIRVVFKKFFASRKIS